MQDETGRKRRAVQRGAITKRSVDQLQPGQSLTDAGCAGFMVRRLSSGTLSYGLRYSVNGRQRWLPIGVGLAPDAARKIAEKRRGEVASGRDPLAEREAEREAARAVETTVNHLLDEHLKRHVKRELRSWAEIERVFDREVRPEIGTKPIYALKRRDIVALLDKIEDRGSPVMADRTLAHLRKALNWWAARDADFNSPIVKGMARTSPSGRARKRVLDDQEIRDLWTALEGFDEPAIFGALVKVLLLTAMRREEAAGMRWSRVSGDVLTIAAEDHKTGDEAGDKIVPLTPEVMALLGTPRRQGYVFSTTRGWKKFSGYSKAKRALDARIAELRKRDAMKHWTLHDLRRTARSLMSRAKVPGDIGEMVLGHKVQGAKGTYDRHEYLDEKREALTALAKLVHQIALPPAGENVVPFVRTG